MDIMSFLASIPAPYQPAKYMESSSPSAGGLESKMRIIEDYPDAH